MLDMGSSAKAIELPGHLAASNAPDDADIKNAVIHFCAGPEAHPAAAGDRRIRDEGSEQGAVVGIIGASHLQGNRPVLGQRSEKTDGIGKGRATPAFDPGGRVSNDVSDKAGTREEECVPRYSLTAQLAADFDRVPQHRLVPCQRRERVRKVGDPE